MSKNPQHDRVKPRGGGARAVYTMCKKTSDLVENGFPNLHFPLMICNGIQQKQDNYQSHGILFINQRGSGGGFTDNLTKWQNPSEKIHNTTYPLLLFFQIFS